MEELELKGVEVGEMMRQLREEMVKVIEEIGEGGRVGVRGNAG